MRPYGPCAFASAGPSGPWGVNRRETCIDTRCANLVLNYNADTATVRSLLPQVVFRNAAVCLPAPQCPRREAVGSLSQPPSATLATLGETISGAKWKESRAAHCGALVRRSGRLRSPSLMGNTPAPSWRGTQGPVRVAPHGAARSARKAVTWLILPVVICLSQRLSHACLSINCLYCETANGSLNQL